MADAPPFRSPTVFQDPRRAEENLAAVSAGHRAGLPRRELQTFAATLATGESAVVVAGRSRLEEARWRADAWRQAARDINRQGEAVLAGPLGPSVGRPDQPEEMDGEQRNGATPPISFAAGQVFVVDGGQPAR